MEKKSNVRSSQSQTKLQSNELKKSQDTPSNKPWPRSNKKREFSNNASGKNETGRKPPVKGKSNFDKRPRPRGAYHDEHMAGTPRARINDDSAEVGSVFLPGSKKQNLNHLLNFQYTPRGGGVGGGRASYKRFHGVVYTNSHKHNNDLFLQSNCQFVVKAEGDFKAHLVDPDVPVSWDLVVQINVRVCEPLTCPICLSELVAGQITRCGHAYCWPCLLHYFSLSEDSNRPCPICFQPIDKSKLKSVQGVWQENNQNLGEISMTLMRRAQGSTLVEPIPEMEQIDSPPGNIMAVSDVNSTLFAKLLTADGQEISKILERERNELNQQINVEEETPERCFIEQALNLLQVKESLICCGNTETTIEPIEEKVTAEEKKHFLPSSACGGLDFVADFNQMSLDNKDSSNNNIALVEDSTDTDNSNHKDLIESATSAPTDPSPSENDFYNYFYFYQASDGQAVFLEGLEIRMLEKSWGSLKYAPRTLKAKILRRTSGSVCDEARRRLRCLRHLPIHCPYDVLQIELKPPIVSPESLASFKNELEERKRQRQRRAREEKRLERVVSQQEQKLMGKSRSMQLHLDSDVHFPVYQPEPVETLGAQHFPSCLPEDRNDEADTPRSSISEASNNSLSFAKMASTSGTWKTRVPEVIATPIAVNRVRCDSENSDTLECAPPSYNVSLSEAISAAILKQSTNKSEDSEGGKGKKKKKQKPKVLFTTGIQHHNATN